MTRRGRRITSGTREWAARTVNCVSGCANDCRYCYAKMMARRFGWKTEETWSDMEIRERDVEKNYGKYDGVVMFPSSHDIVDIPEVKEACFTVIGKLLDAGNRLLITTKPSLNVTREMMEKFGEHRPRIQFRFTITSNDDDLLAFWEPNAPSYGERLEALRLTYGEGFRNSVSIEPFLDEDLRSLVEELEPYVTDTIWVGTMNYIPRRNIPEKDRHEYARVRRIVRAGNLKRIYEELHEHPKIRFKDSIAIKLGIPDINPRKSHSP